MKDDADTLFGHMNKLLELVELARDAAPEDCARLECTIGLAGRALLASAQAQEAVNRARRLTEEVDADMVQRQSELAALLEELRIIGDHTSK